MMKNLVFLYAGNNPTHAFDDVFSGKSAFKRCLEWTRKIPDCGGVIILSSTENEDKIKCALAEANINDFKIILREKWLCRDLIVTMSAEVASAKAENAVYTDSNRPFLDESLTEEVLACHEKYIAEYTFADGYPLGFAPEVIHSGTLNILSTFATETHRNAADVEVSSECIFNLLKTDINSFEIESVIAPKDYRMSRFDFSCGTKRNLLACKNLYEKALEKNVAFTAAELSDLALGCAQVQQTLPAFYNVQVSRNCASIPMYSPYPEAYKKKYGVLPLETENAGEGGMSLEKFNGLVSQIADFSEDAVIGLSAFGEPLLEKNIVAYAESVLQNRNLSLLIETDGTHVTADLASRLAEISGKYGPRNNGEKNIIWIVSIDAVSEAMYSSLVEYGSFEKAVSSVGILAKCFPGSVYPQFTRMNENEPELESFYRYWHDKNSPSSGNLIIQKYDDCCKTLPSRKPADLAPLERFPCWHIKRDMTILSDGSVPLCRQYLLDSSIGNVFDEGIEKIWEKTLATVNEHIAGDYSEKCRKCDDYYTFNF